MAERVKCDTLNGGLGALNLHGVAHRLDDLERYLETKIGALTEIGAERDRRYEDRFKAQETAVQAALAAQEKFNSAVSAASKEAILKAEASQTGVNERSNEFRGQLADQASTLMPRKETETLIASVREILDKEIHSLRVDVTSLRDSRNQASGWVGGAANLWVFIAGAIGVISAITMIIVTITHK